MNNKSIDSKNLILNLLYFTMVFSLIYIVGIVIRLELSFFRQVFLVFAITMTVRFVIRNSIVLYLTLIISFLGGLLVNSYITPIYPYFNRFSILFNNIYEHIFMGELLQSENILPFWVLMTIIYSLFTAISIFRARQETFSLLLIYLPLFIYYWYIYVNEAYFALALFLFAYSVLRGLISYKKERRKIEPGLREHFSHLSPFWSKTTLVYGIIIVFVAILLPKSDNNIRWIWMEDQISSIVPKIEEMRSSDTNIRGSAQAGIFNLAQTGFQESTSQLGGPISPNNNTVMYVRADRPTYLRGAVRYFYDGSSWDSSTSNTNSATNHLLETNFSTIDDIYRQEYYDERDIIVQFVDYASTTLFSPYMPIVVNAQRGEQVTVNDDHIMRLTEGVYDGESYGVKVLESKPYYELINRGINNYPDHNINWNNYLQLPQQIFTQRTIDLKDEILTGVQPGIYENYEKARAIESYLRENFEYTLDTSPVPSGHEFIDYFLFEEEAGYCTYYATTMAIFLRLEGIPSRYVEGYIAHEPSDDGVYEVRQSHAHAWVEAYIEPVGWITFEPTPAYPVDDRQPEVEEEVVEEETQEDDVQVDNDFESDMDISSDDNMAMDNEGTLESDSEEAISSRTMILITLGIMALILPVRYLIRIIRYRINEYKIRKLANDKRMLVVYEKILQLVEKLGHPRKSGETHYEFAKRVGYKFSQLSAITNTFVENKYGHIKPSDEEIKIFEDYRLDLEEQLKNNLGKIKYYLKKY